MKFAIILVNLNLITFNYVQAFKLSNLTKGKRDIPSVLYLPPKDIKEELMLGRNPAKTYSSAYASAPNGDLFKNPVQNHFTISLGYPGEGRAERYIVSIGSDIDRNGPQVFPIKSSGESFPRIIPDHISLIKPVGGYNLPASHTNFRYNNYPVNMNNRNNFNVGSGVSALLGGSSFNERYFSTTLSHYDPQTGITTLYAPPLYSYRDNFNNQQYFNIPANYRPPSYATDQKGLGHYKSKALFLANDVSDTNSSGDDSNGVRTTEPSRITFKPSEILQSSHGSNTNSYRSSVPRVQGHYQPNQYNYQSQLYLPPTSGSSSHNTLPAPGSYLPPHVDSIPGSSYLPYASTSMRDPEYPRR